MVSPISCSGKPFVRGRGLPLTCASARRWEGRREDEFRDCEVPSDRLKSRQVSRVEHVHTLFACLDKSSKLAPTLLVSSTLPSPLWCHTKFYHDTNWCFDVSPTRWRRWIFTLGIHRESGGNRACSLAINHCLFCSTCTPPALCWS